jgi:hypothetical protein
MPEHNKNRQCAPAGPDAKTAARLLRRCGKRYVSCVIRNAIALLMLISAFAIGDGAPESGSANDFYITITANHLYLCGEGFGGMYGCIDEAISREAKSVVISASSGATVQAVQELLTAVHAVGFDQVGVATFNEDDT